LNGGVTYSKPARTATRRIRIRRIRVAGLLVVIAAIATALGYQSGASSSTTATSPTDVPRGEHRGLRSEHRGAPGEPGALGERGALGEADGAVPDGTTVFDDEIPGVANLDPALLGALRQAATDAADDGVEFFVDSGWRSSEYQNQLLVEAVSEYGSEEEAARWVATAETSGHVSGDAVDVGPEDATAWLSEHGAAYGLCQIYGNEPWHYELRAEAIDHGCPPMYADPTHDPRMQQ
jgi:D-alanyl-D-alanine carboxypeptidase